MYGFDISGENIISANLDTLDLSEFDVVFFPISGINSNMEIKTEKRKFNFTYFTF